MNNVVLAYVPLCKRWVTMRLTGEPASEPLPSVARGSVNSGDSGFLG